MLNLQPRKEAPESPPQGRVVNKKQARGARCPDKPRMALDTSGLPGAGGLGARSQRSLPVPSKVSPSGLQGRDLGEWERGGSLCPDDHGGGTVGSGVHQMQLGEKSARKSGLALCCGPAVPQVGAGPPVKVVVAMLSHGAAMAPHSHGNCPLSATYCPPSVPAEPCVRGAVDVVKAAGAGPRPGDSGGLVGT